MTISRISNASRGSLIEECLTNSECAFIERTFSDVDIDQAEKDLKTMPPLFGCSVLVKRRGPLDKDQKYYLTISSMRGDASNPQLVADHFVYDLNDKKYAPLTANIDAALTDRVRNTFAQMPTWSSGYKMLDELEIRVIAPELRKVIQEQRNDLERECATGDLNVNLQQLHQQIPGTYFFAHNADYANSYDLYINQLEETAQYLVAINDKGDLTIYGAQSATFPNLEELKRPFGMVRHLNDPVFLVNPADSETSLADILRQQVKTPNPIRVTQDSDFASRILSGDSNLARQDAYAGRVQSGDSEYSASLSSVRASQSASPDDSSHVQREITTPQSKTALLSPRSPLHSPFTLHSNSAFTPSPNRTKALLPRHHTLPPAGAQRPAHHIQLQFPENDQKTNSEEALFTSLRSRLRQLAFAKESGQP